MNDQVRPLAQTIWDYHRLGQSLAPADAVVVLGSHDEIVAERGAQLFLEGWAPLLVFSGGRGAITSRLWNEPEAERFARIAVGMGVAPEDILIEPRSTNSGENVLFTRRLFRERQIDARRILAVQKPYMERRTWATFRKLWPEADVIVTSPRFSLDDYLKRVVSRHLSEDDVIGIMVGDLHRIRLYPERGFQVPQEIPREVWDAFETLVDAGYDRYLVRG